MDGETRGPGKAYRPIPVQMARTIALEFAKDLVIILAVDRAHGKTHSTTFARHPALKEFAAQLAEKCMASIGHDLSKAESFEDFRITPAAETAATIDRLTAERDALQAAHDRVMNLLVGPEMRLVADRDDSIKPTGRWQAITVTEEFWETFPSRERAVAHIIDQAEEWARKKAEDPT
jgi:hypothetical protein